MKSIGLTRKLKKHAGDEGARSVWIDRLLVSQRRSNDTCYDNTARLGLNKRLRNRGTGILPVIDSGIRCSMTGKMTGKMPVPRCYETKSRQTGFLVLLVLAFLMTPIGVASPLVAQQDDTFQAPAQPSQHIFESDGSERFMGILRRLTTELCEFEDHSAANPVITTLPRRDLNRIQFSAEPNSPPPTSGPHTTIQLVDGSICFVPDVTVVNGQVTFPRFTSEELTLELNTRDVAYLDFTGKSQTSRDRWLAIAQDDQQLADRLILTREQTLDFVEGLVGDVLVDTVEVRVDDRSVEAKRSRIDGIVYYHAAGRQFSEPIALLETVYGQFFIRSLNLEENEFLDEHSPIYQVETIAGSQLSFFESELVAVDVSLGRLVYLSDLEPSTYDWQPLYQESPLQSYQRLLQRPSRDQSFSGRTLSLEYSREFPHDMRKDEKTFSKGLAVKGGTRLVYSIGGQYQRLQGHIGFDPSALNDGAVEILILGDGRELLRSPLQKHLDDPIALDLPIQAVNRLSIQIDYFDERNVGDVIHLCDLKVVK